MNCGVGHRLGSDPELLWLWCRLVAVAQIRSLAWEPPSAMGVALRSKKKKKVLKKVHSSSLLWVIMVRV